MASRKLETTFQRLNAISNILETYKYYLCTRKKEKQFNPYYIIYRTRTCGDLRLDDEGLVITLAGSVQKTRKMGGMTFVDIRDRYGITQLVFNQEVFQ